ncbi:MAG: L-threonylcarbamoyladenylate synthase [Candidatus Marinimicrobia bacterium]|nr:L-threonylcarbamoyladenylate synthase [Candidatus Neomarinimicrobiota bacterium]
MKFHNSRIGIKKTISTTINVLENDGIIVYPTDTIYGFGADVFSEIAINKIINLKNRNKKTPFSIIVPSKEYLFEKVIINDRIKKIVNKFMPGAVTFILPTKKNVFPKIFYSENKFVGYRIPNNDFCLKLTSKYDKPIITTSINLSGELPLNKIDNIINNYHDKIEVYIKDDELEKKSNPIGSTIIKITEDNNVILIRSGKISFSDIIKIIE